MEKELLIPLEVPWMVSPSLSGTNVCTWEGDSTYVAFNVALHDGVDFQGDPADPQDARAVLKFRAGLWTRLYPPEGEDFPLDSPRFDTTSLPRLEANHEDYLELFSDNWVGSQVCPDPRCYRVERSRWLSESSAKEHGCEHFLIVGDQLVVEVLARGVSWEYMKDRTPSYNDPVVSEK